MPAQDDLKNPNSTPAAIPAQQPQTSSARIEEATQKIQAAKDSTTPEGAHQSLTTRLNKTTNTDPASTLILPPSVRPRPTSPLPKTPEQSSPTGTPVVSSTTQSLRTDLPQNSQNGAGNATENLATNFNRRETISSAIEKIQQAKQSAPLSQMEQANKQINNAVQAGITQSPQNRIERAMAEGKAQGSIGLILPTKMKESSSVQKPQTIPRAGAKEVPTSSLSNSSQGKSSKLTSALALGVGGAFLATKAGAGVLRGIKSPENIQNTSENWTSFLKPAFDRWSMLLLIYPELRDVKSLPAFKIWLEKHKGEINPENKEPFSPNDWIDHNAYEDYRTHQKELESSVQKENKETAREKHENQTLHAITYTYHPEIAGINEQPTIPPSSSSYSPSSASYNSPNTSPLSPALSPVSQPTRQSAGGNSSAPPSGPTSKGRGGMGKLGGKLASKAINVLPAGRVVTTIWKKKGLIAGIGGGLLFFLILIFSESAPTGKVPASVEISTTNTEVSSTDTQAVKGTSTLAVLPAGYQGVLGITDTFKVLLKKLVEGAQKVEELAQKYKDSLITYTITANYGGQADEVIVHYPIPPNGLFISATGNYEKKTEIDPDTGLQRVTELTWKFSQNANTSSTSTGTDLTRNTTQGTSSDTTKNSDPATARNSGSGTTTTDRNTDPATARNSTIDFNKYTQAPYLLPTPTGASDVIFSSDTISEMNNLGNLVAKYQTYLTSKYAAKYVDPFLSPLWNSAIEGIGTNQSYWVNGKPYFWNCGDTSYDINAGCPGGYSSGQWQVGYGMQVAQVSGHLASDFDAAYGVGSSTNASKVQQVGQAVISNSSGKIKNPSTFPSTTIESLVGKADSGDQNAQQNLAVLLLDPDLGAITLSLEIASDISGHDNWASTMSGWADSYRTGLQSFSNRGKELASQYSGVSTGGNGNTATSGLGTRSFTITVLPIAHDELFNSGKASLEVIGARGGSTSPSSSGTTQLGDITLGKNTPPNKNTCNGTYTLSGGQHNGDNFGDPDCTLANSPRTSYDFMGKHWDGVPQALIDLLKKLDPSEVGYWIGISACEAPGFDPNNVTYFVGDVHTPDATGAWGLFQMGSHGPYTPGDGTNGQYDRGDVNWQNQVSNAVNDHLIRLNGGWGYYGCAAEVWGL